MTRWVGDGHAPALPYRLFNCLEYRYNRQTRRPAGLGGLPVENALHEMPILHSQRLIIADMWCDDIAIAVRERSVRRGRFIQRAQTALVYAQPFFCQVVIHC